MPDSAGLGEQALNKVVEIGLSSQLDEVESLDVNVKADPFQLLQGHVDTVAIDGEGLVMQKSLRVEELHMQVDTVAINPLSVAFGKLELTEPVQGTASIVLTQADINVAFNSGYIRDKLQHQTVDINGESVVIVPEKIDFNLPGESRVQVDATLRLKENNQIQRIAFAAVPNVSHDGKKIHIENVEYAQGKEMSPTLTKALVDASSEILNLNNFDLKGMSLKIKTLAVEIGKLILTVEANVQQIPSM
jgi:LmeA-like phospholipid-binding